jgi:ribA/ribD-fused uncharacterized protein
MATKVAKQPKPPKDENQVVKLDKKLEKIKAPKTITAFFRSRDKYPEYFFFTADGSLGTRLVFGPKGAEGHIEGPPAKLFDIPKYAPLNREEIDTLWATRQSNFDEIYESIEAAKKGLREAIAAYQSGAGTAREVVVANQLVADEEAKLIANRSPKRWVEIIPNPTTNFIDLKQKYEERKLGYDVYMLKQFEIDPQSLLRAMTKEEIAAAVASGGGEHIYGVITDETLLGLHWPADIKVGNTQYFTAFQAILGEMARQAQNQDLFQSILGTRSSRTLRSLTKEVESSAYTSEILDSVIKAFAKQFPEFRELLLKTGDEQLVYANVMDPIFSIGLDQDDPTIQNAKAWRGENLWGQALEKARTEFREKNVTSKPEDDGISEKEEATPENTVISKEAQEAAKKAAIINARRFHKNH